MQIVIEIDEEDYKIMKHNIAVNNPLCPLSQEEMVSKVANGTPLPKGHRRLKDESDLDLFAPSLGTDEHINDLMAKHNIDYVNGDDEDKVRAFASDLIRSCMNVIKTAPTIIEADKEREDIE